MVISIQRQIHCHYTLRACIYDKIIEMGKANTIKPREVLINNLQLNSIDKLLELAVGTGLNFPFYPKGLSIYGVDNNDGMLKYAKKRKRSLGLDNVTLVQADVRDLPFDSDFFQVGVITYGLSAIPNQEDVISEMCRVVLPDGKIGIIDFSSDIYHPFLFGTIPLDLSELVSKFDMEIIYHKKYPFFNSWLARYFPISQDIYIFKN